MKLIVVISLFLATAAIAVPISDAEKRGCTKVKRDEVFAAVRSAVDTVKVKRGLTETDVDEISAALYGAILDDVPAGTTKDLNRVTAVGLDLLLSLFQMLSLRDVTCSSPITPIPGNLFFDQHDTSVGSRTDVAQHRSRASTAPELLWTPDDFTNAISITNPDGLKLFNDIEDVMPDSISNSVGLQPQSKSKQSSDRHSLSDLSSIIQDPKTPQVRTARCGTSKVKGKSKDCSNRIQQLSKSIPTPQSLKNTSLPLNLDSSGTQSTVPVSGNIGILQSGNISRHIGKTALHISAERGNLSIVQFLLLSGVDVNGTDSLGRTALHYAAHSGSLDVASQLLTTSADLDIQDHEGRSPLHLAADAECEVMIRFLAQEGADLNATIGCSEDISSGEEDNNTCEATWS